MLQSGPSIKRRDVVAVAAAAVAAAAGAGTLIPVEVYAAAAVDIRPFEVQVPDEPLADLRQRIANTKWPRRELVEDASRGVQLATMRKLADYWANSHDWRNVEARLNAWPQFVTEIDGLNIHFIHVRSKHSDAMPVIITHGWPGSVIEQMKVIGPLTDPTAHGGTPEDAFDVVILSLPGYGFSGQPTAIGWDPRRIARAWTVLMTHRPTNGVPTISSTSSTSMASATPRKLQTGPRLFTDWGTHRSASPPGCSTTTRAAIRSSAGSSMVRTRA